MAHRAALATACLALIPVVAGAGEISLFGAYSSGDYGTGIDTESQSTVFRYFTGDRVQFRVDVPWLRVQTNELVVRPGPGPAPRPPRPGQGPNAGAGGSGATGSTGAAGLGSGSGEASSDSPGEELVDGPSNAELSESWSTGIGDLRLGGFFRVLGGGAKVYRMDTGLEVKTPTADNEQNLGTGEWDYRGTVSGQYRFWSATAFGTLGWNLLGDPSWVELNDVLDLIVGAESEPVLGGRIVLSGWLEGNQEIVDGTGDRSALGLGLRSNGKLRWRVLTTVGLGGAAEDFAFAFGLSMGVVPPKTGIGGLRL
jgi:hypothetical protein